MPSGTYGGGTYGGGASIPPSTFTPGGRDKLIIGGLDLNDLANYYIGEDGVEFTPARKKLNWIGNPSNDGSVQAGTEDHYENAELVAVVNITQRSTPDLARQALDALTNVLQTARKTPGGLPLAWTPQNAAVPLTWYVLNAEYDEMPTDKLSGYSDSAPSVRLHLYMAPFGYGGETQQTLGYTEPWIASTTYNPILGGRWRFDEGSPASVTVANGELAAASTVTDRLYLPFTTTDVVLTERVHVGSVVAGHVGFLVKRITANSYLGARLRGDTNLVEIYKYTGSASSLASAAFTPTASTYYWLQAQLSDDDINFTVYAADQNPLETTDPTPLATVSHTLTAGNEAIWGAGIRGNPGIYLAPSNPSPTQWTVADFIARGMPDIKTSEPLGVFEVPSVLGQVPAEARMVVTEGGAKSKAHFEWGLEQRSYNASEVPPLILDSTVLVTTGYSGSQGIVTGSYDPYTESPTNYNAIVSDALSSTQAVAVCSFGQLRHVGIFKVKARVAGTAGVRVRLAWRGGLTPFVHNNYTDGIIGGLERTPPVNIFQEVDLGTVVIPTTNSGDPNWTGRIEAYSPLNANGVLQVDYVELIPLERYGVCRAPLRPVVPDVFVARDAFGGSGTFNGSALDLGGTWATAGTGTFGFNIQDHTIERAQVSDANLISGCFAIAGTATYGAVQVQADFDGSSGPAPATDTLRSGVFARYSSPTNWAMAVRQNYFGKGGDPHVRLRVFKCVAGVPTLLGSIDSADVKLSTNRTIILNIDTEGVWWAAWFNAGAKQPATPQLQGQDTELATSLAVGKIGVYDAYTAASPAFTRIIDNFSAFSVTQDAVMFPSSHLEIRSDSAERDGLGIWGRVPEYNGQRLYLPPGLSRMVVKARRTNVDEGQPDLAASGVATPVVISDPITVSLTTRARYLTPVGAV